MFFIRYYHLLENGGGGVVIIVSWDVNFRRNASEKVGIGHVRDISGRFVLMPSFISLIKFKLHRCFPPFVMVCVISVSIPFHLTFDDYFFQMNHSYRNCMIFWYKDVTRTEL